MLQPQNMASEKGLSLDSLNTQRNIGQNPLLRYNKQKIKKNDPYNIRLTFIAWCTPELFAKKVK